MVTPKKIAGISSTRVFSIRARCSMMILVFLAMGCGLASNILTTKNRSDTAAESPTASQGSGFHDDFTAQLDPAWTWQNEDASHYKVDEGGWLEIIGGNESILAGGQQKNLLWTPLPEGDFAISIHLKSQPLFDFQQAGFLFYEDSEHFISLTRGYCRQCVLGGSGVFLEYNLEGDRMRYAAATDATDLYLMLIHTRGVLSGFYAIEAGQWSHVASLRSETRFYRVGLSVTNDSIWDEGLDVVGMFDFFEIRPSYHPKPALPQVFY